MFGKCVTNEGTAQNTLSKVYDGNIWKQFTDKNFFNDEGSSAMLNCDWFQPYKYSVGAVYLTVLNLPGLLLFQIWNKVELRKIPPPFCNHSIGKTVGRLTCVSDYAPPLFTLSSYGAKLTSYYLSRQKTATYLMSQSLLFSRSWACR